MGKQSTIFFPSLNGLRFIAAFAVVIHHLEQTKLFFGLPSLFNEWHFVKIVGELGVTLFFTLSGFLITYLLLAEKERFNTIDIKKFYIRRVLRIWPLYYLIILLGLFVLPYIGLFEIPKYTEGVHDAFGWKVFFYMILFPNVVSNAYAYMPYIAQTWSIGVEEQFYLLWAPIFKFSQNYLKVFLTIIICLLLITNILYFFADHSKDISTAGAGTKLVTYCYRFFSTFRITCMAIGSIGAYYLYCLDMKILRPLFSPYTQLITYIIVIEMLLFGLEIPFINHEVYALLFIIIILNLAANPESYVNLENKMMDYLGKISYSIYMWHPIAIVVCLKIATTYNPKLDGIFSNGLYYCLTFALTILLSILSYEYFEMRFLKLKQVFTKVTSGNLTFEEDDDLNKKGEKNKILAVKKTESSPLAQDSNESNGKKTLAISRTVLPD
jgi:peptidoglycan/LPS O-acetylase OafA/YrhL